MKPRWRFLLLVAAVVVSASATHAEVRYVRDLIIVNMRAAANDNAESIKLVRTGEALELITTQGDFLRVRDAEGTVGWIHKQYLTEDAPAMLRLAEVEAEMAQAKAERDAAVKKLNITSAALREELAAVQAKLDEETRSSGKALSQSRAEASESATRLAKLEKEHALLQSKSGKVIEIDKERQALADENERLARQMAIAAEQLEEQQSNAAVKWFIAGAAAILLGWSLGLATGRKKRTSSWR